MTNKEAKKYLRKWYPHLERMRVLGLGTYGFDPGLTVFDMKEDSSHRVNLSLPAWFVARLEAMIIELHPEMADDEAMYQRHKKWREEYLAVSKPKKQ